MNATTPRIKLWRIADLRPHPKNPRKHSDAAVAALADLIQDVGWTSPAIIDDTGMILAGHKRRLAAIRLGLKKMPCVVREGLSKADKLAIVVGDNAHTIASPWDRDLLSITLDELRDMDFELSMLGFGEDLGSFLRAPEEGDVVGDPLGEWSGMPEFENEDKTAYRSLVVHFPDQKAVDDFAKLVGHKVTEQTRMLWYPEIEIERYVDKEYAGDESSSASVS